MSRYSCLRCGKTSSLHLTFYDPRGLGVASQAAEVLCESCWSVSSPAERLQFTRQYFDAQVEAGLRIAHQWPPLELAVLNPLPPPPSWGAGPS